jgi:hypothetical protein
VSEFINCWTSSCMATNVCLEARDTSIYCTDGITISLISLSCDWPNQILPFKTMSLLSCWFGRIIKLKLRLSFPWCVREKQRNIDSNVLLRLTEENTRQRREILSLSRSPLIVNHGHFIIGQALMFWFQIEPRIKRWTFSISYYYVFMRLTLMIYSIFALLHTTVRV